MQSSGRLFSWRNSKLRWRIPFNLLETSEIKNRCNTTDKKKQSSRSVFEFIRVPQVSKVRFSSAPWMVSLHPWWVVKLSFFTGSLQRFLPGGSPSDFPHIPVCSCSCVSCRSVIVIISKQERLSTKKVKKSAFF